MCRARSVLPNWILTSEIRFQKQSFPYKLISDPERLLISRLTGNASKTIRSHAVVDSKGKLVDIKLGVSPAESSKSALEAAKKAA